MTSKSTAFLSVKDLVVEYTAGGQVIHAVNGISFDLQRGKVLGLVGETGAGKTSTAKAILRILPDPPARIVGGEIDLDGEDLLKLSNKEMRRIRGRKVSMIFQDPMTALNPIMKVGAQIAEVIRLHEDVTKQEAADKAKRCWSWSAYRGPSQRVPPPVLWRNEAEGGHRDGLGLQPGASSCRRTDDGS